MFGASAHFPDEVYAQQGINCMHKVFRFLSRCRFLKSHHWENDDSVFTTHSTTTSSS